MFADCTLDADQLERFRQHFVGDDSTVPLMDIIRQLSLLDPLFMGGVLLQCIRHGAVVDAGDRTPEDQVRLARNGLLGLGVEAGGGEIHVREKAILVDAAESMGVDDHFLDNVAGKALKRLGGDALADLDSANLATAVGVKPFRDYLSVRILDAITSLI